MSLIEKSFADTGGFGTERKTMINPEKVEAAVNKLPDVEEALKNIGTSLSGVSEPLEATWIGTARESYKKASNYVQQEIQKIEVKIASLYEAIIQVCDERKSMDQEISDAATIS